MHRRVYAALSLLSGVPEFRAQKTPYSAYRITAGTLQEIAKDCICQVSQALPAINGESSVQLLGI